MNKLRDTREKLKDTREKKSKNTSEIKIEKHGVLETCYKELN